MTTSISNAIQTGRRRVAANAFLHRLMATLSAGFVLAIGLAFADKLYHWGESSLALFAVAVGFGLLLAIGWTAWRWPTALEAALAVDRACELKERLSTAASLPAERRDEPAAQALLADLERRLADAEIAERLPIARPKYPWAPAVAALALLAVIFWVPSLDWLRNSAEEKLATDERDRVVEQSKILAEKEGERQKKIAESDLGADLKELSAKIVDASQSLETKNEIRAKDAVVELSDLAQKIEEQRKALGAVDATRQALSRLQKTKDGAANDLNNALRNSDFSKAAEEVERLRKRLKNNEMTKEERQKRGDELAQLHKSLDRLANMKSREEQLRKNLPPESLEQELAKLSKESQQLDDLKRLSKQLEDAADQLQSPSSTPTPTEAADDLAQALEEALKNQPDSSLDSQEMEKLAREAMGRLSKQQLAQLRKMDVSRMKKSIAQAMKASKLDPKDAPEIDPEKLQQMLQDAEDAKPNDSQQQLAMDQSLENAEQILQQMQKGQMQAQMLDQMKGDLSQARTAMFGGKPPNRNSTKQSNQVGPGLGAGQGQGARPERETATTSAPTRAPTKDSAGKIVYQGKTEGGAFRGDSHLEIQTAAAEARKQANDAVTRQAVPREYRQHTQEYFDKLNSGLNP